MLAVILAAGMGTRLGHLTKSIPKAFLLVKKQPLIEHSLDNLKKAGIKNVIIVVGHLDSVFRRQLGNSYKGMKIIYVTNKNYASTGSMYSLSQTEGLIDDNILLLESDILYEYRALQKLITSHYKDAIIVSQLTGSDDSVFICKDAKDNLTNLGKNITYQDEAIGELVGITKLSLRFLKHLYASAKQDYAANKMNYHYEECILQTSRTHPIKCVLVNNLAWIEIDTEKDLRKAKEIVYKKIFDN